MQNAKLGTAKKTVIQSLYLGTDLQRESQGALYVNSDSGFSVLLSVPKDIATCSRIKHTLFPIPLKRTRWT